MYQQNYNGNSFDMGYAIAYMNLKLFLISGSGWSCIDTYDRAKYIHNLFKVWKIHYNRHVELTKNTALS